jgi:hypothetical protein
MRVDAWPKDGVKKRGRGTLRWEWGGKSVSRVFCKIGNHWLHYGCRVSSAVEQRFCKPKVGGSIPSPGTNENKDLQAFFTSSGHKSLAWGNVWGNRNAWKILQTRLTSFFRAGLVNKSMLNSDFGFAAKLTKNMGACGRRLSARIYAGRG